ncbi:MAG: rhodanese-like domain-containing protein [Chloroflexi bacterium]|nr:rhodanese-like domain-containing protein [Chloroflexota bacterium]
MLKRRLVLLIVLLLIVPLALVACGGDDDDDNGDDGSGDSGGAAATYTEIDTLAAYQQFGQSADAVLIDVRHPQNPNEFATLPADDRAVLIEWDDADGRFVGDTSLLPNEKDTPVYVICNSGNRSERAAAVLVNMGYTTVFSVDGGMQVWSNIQSAPQ